MIKSMTGFGKATCELPGKKISIEIKSLNSKQLDVSMRLPNIYREKDLILRNEIATKLGRGKVDVGFYIDFLGNEKNTSINAHVIENYFNQLSPIADKLGLIDKTDILRAIMPLPDTIKTEQAELDDEEWKKIAKTFSEALNCLNEFRTQEGQTLKNDITSRIENIRSLSLQVEPYEKERIEKIRERILDQLNELKEKIKVDQNRFEQEMIFYLEKLDITEEKVRLANHLDYFLETIANEEMVGKKLGFITQEIGREINTLGSKANHSEVQKLVIQMKDELEKIKEQNLNIL
ncbi:YicC/YloC family endoribonuclease [Plebeiibacterium sediminum]|uniref:YicC family protein n=1 Tax=Plebeiibacterium sediminum TaxID=2992112 RepID=A0AAE3M1V3_9BACT|nr:YicC/YloC family endoribonuclease [Plebeiobacterium sediminum]MCW3785406.1 YicC family protein [Plebeiobacterium sediminum]